MDKKIRTIIIGGVVLIVLIAVMMVLMVMQPTTEEKGNTGSSVYLSERNINHMTKLSIKNTLDEYEIERSEDELYTIEKLEGLLADQADCKKLFANMAVIQATSVIEEEPEDLEQYGLKSPIVVTATMDDGSEYTLNLGSKSPTSTGYYAQISGDTKVYLVSIGYYMEYRTKAAKDLTDRVLTKDETSSENEDIIQKIELSRIDLPYTMVFEQTALEDEAHMVPYVASPFVMTSPIHAYIESTYFDDVAVAGRSLKATSVVEIHPSEEKLAEYGFDEPLGVFVSERKDGTVDRIEVGNECYKDPTEDEPASTQVVGYYVRLVGRDVVYYAGLPQLYFMTATTFNLISQIPFAPDITTVDTLKVDTGSEVYDVDFIQGTDDYGNSKVTGTINGHEVDKPRLSTLYVNLVSALANEIYLEKPESDPILTYEFKFNDPSLKDLKVEFHDIGDRKASITINGQTRFATRLAYVPNFCENIKTVMEGGEANLNY